MEEKNIIIFGDSVGRLLIGNKINETDEVVVIDSPHVIEADLSTTPDGKPKQGLKFVPSYYPELFALDSQTTWTFPKSTHSFNNSVVSKEASDHYNQLLEAYARIRQKQAAQEAGSDEIKLVD